MGKSGAGIASFCLAVFSKSAVPGRVKTRLIGELSAEQAADLHAAFLADLIEEMRRGRFDLRVAWALDPGELVPSLAVESMRQSGEDLGERLYGALADLASEYPFVAAVGSDHPGLSASRVRQAFDKLVAGAEVVLGPAGDGGYYLVAARGQALRREIFADIPWSSSDVLRATLDTCQRLGMTIDLLPTLPDVDTAEDLDRLISRLERDPSLECPRTRALLTSWKRLSVSDSRGESHENP